MNPDKAITRLEEDFDPDRRCPALLEANTVDSFIKWLNDNLEYLEALERGRWRVGVLRPHVETRSDWESLQRNLAAAHIVVLNDTLTLSDELLVTEMLRAYFGGNGTYRKAAQLLAYGRKQIEDGDDVQVISRIRNFRLIPNVQLYFIPDVDYKGSDDDAMLLRALDTLGLHPLIKRAAYERIMDRDYPIAIDQATKMLIDEIRQIGIVHSLPFASEINDRPMVDKALRMSEPDGTGGMRRCTPHIRLNNLSTTSEQSEQQGYRDIIYGIVGAVRNPLAHAPVDVAFIRERFQDRRTALKLLCLLSLLIEKLENRTAPR